MSDRPTPETDAARHFLGIHDWNADTDEPAKTLVSVIARLERERDEAREDRDGMRKAKDWRDYQDRLEEIETTQTDE